MRWFGILAVVGMAALVGGELIARHGYGLGDPPLSVGDQDIDYIFRPNQHCSRFGNRIWYNDLSMRMDADVSGAAPARRKLFVVGDSVVNGGALTDQDDLATSILQHEFPKWLVCNVSAGSWGPGNYVAYFRRHPSLVGTNDVLFLEVASHDLWEDDPRDGAGKIVGVDVSFPARRPFCALSDGWFRYALPRLRRWMQMTPNGKGEEGVGDAIPKIGQEHSSQEAENTRATYNLDCCRWLFGLPFAKKFLVIHRTADEWRNGKIAAGESAFVRCAKKAGVPVVLLRLEPGKDYRDTIHLNKNGQAKLARAIAKAMCP